ncbi:uncharacterized protein LOC134450567 isoform X2 [Engraulis encrasicolus]|uniref:uncharacterized protein LOC134450567 isoform X2 n=1 Tax=Engraulis encrasicolus TaxID=184585 RepID=UPI002FCFE2D2
MSADLKDVMRRTLDDLTESDFKRFKHYLRDYNQQGESRIAWGRLERADQYDTVDLIVQVYFSDAGDAMLSVLQKMNQNQLARSLEKDLGGIHQGGSGSRHGGSSSAANAGMGRVSGPEFFQKHKRDLEMRLGVLGPILAELEYCDVLSPVEREEVESKATRSQQNRALLVMLHSKGSGAQEEFYKALLENDKYLVKDLMSPPF